MSQSSHICEQFNMASIALEFADNTIEILRNNTTTTTTTTATKAQS